MSQINIVVAHTVKLLIKAQQVTAAPPVGSSLAPKKVNIGQFCQKLNADTKKYAPGTPLRVIVYIDPKGQFEYVLKSPLTSYWLIQAAKAPKGIAQAGKDAPVGSITKAQLQEIAQIKMADMNTNDLDKVMRIVAGSARSSGIQITGYKG